MTDKEIITKLLELRREPVHVGEGYTVAVSRRIAMLIDELIESEALALGLAMYKAKDELPDDESCIEITISRRDFVVTAMDSNSHYVNYDWRDKSIADDILAALAAAKKHAEGTDG